MEFWIYVGIICIAAIAIAAKMDVITSDELNEDPWKKDSI